MSITTVNISDYCYGNHFKQLNIFWVTHSEKYQFFMDCLELAIYIFYLLNSY